jgi:hypothetical protein
MTDTTTFSVADGVAQITMASQVLWLIGILVWFGLYATYTTVRDTVLDLLFRLSMWKR